MDLDETPSVAPLQSMSEVQDEDEEVDEIEELGLDLSGGEEPRDESEDKEDDVANIM